MINAPPEPAEHEAAELRSEDVESVELAGPVKYVTANGVRSAEGQPLLHDKAYYTLNYFVKE